MFSLPLLRHRVTWGVPSAPGESGLAVAAALGLLGSTLWACGGPCGLPALNEDEAAVTESGHVSDLSGRVLIFFATTVRCARSIDPKGSKQLPAPDAQLTGQICQVDGQSSFALGFNLAWLSLP